MKIKLFVAACLLTPLWAFSQMNSSLDFSVGINNSFRELSVSTDDEMLKNIIDIRNEYEHGKLNWRLGLNYNQRITKSIFLRTGLSFASLGNTVSNVEDFLWPDEHDGNGQVIQNPDKPEEFIVKTDYWFFEIPIVGRIEFGTGKFTPFFEMGLAPSVYYKTRSKSIVEGESETMFIDQTKNDLFDFNRMHLAVLAAVGLNYSLNEQVQIFGQPSIKCHLTKLVENDLGEYLYAYGLELGVRKSL